ncbi:MAG: hypothetical protein Q4G55_06000 [bacterium]|nr:hypothetical protein [bacterium]
MKLLHNGARALGGLLLLASTAWAEDAQTWRYFAADAADNPYPNRACITNGTAWALAVDVVDADARTLRIACAGTAANAYLTDPANAPTLDLRGTVFGADETTTYTITKIAPQALGGDATKGTATAVVTPGTLTGDFEAWFAGFQVDADGASIDECFADYATITVDEPNLTGRLKTRLVPRTNNPIRWTVHVPQITYVEGSALTSSRSGGSLSNQTGTFTVDSFTSVRTIDGNGMSNRKFDGVLHLPVVESIGSYGVSGTYPGYFDIQLGAETRSVRYLPTGSCGWMTNPTNLVLGLAAGNTMGKEAFTSFPRLRRVEFTGYPPNFTTDAANVFTGPGIDSITFIVPPSAAWAAYLAPFAANGDFIRWSGDQIRAWRAEHPEGPVVIGTVNGTVFKSDTRHYLAVSDRTSSWIGLDFDTAYGDTVETVFEIDDAAPFNVALRLTVRANAATGGTFAGWYGDVPDGKSPDTTLVLRDADFTRWAFARFTHPWTLTRDGDRNALLDNGTFRLQATVDGAARTVTLGRGAACSLYAPDNTGDGVLDLGGAVTGTDGLAYRIVSLGGNHALLSSAKGDTIPGARIFVTPGTLTSVGSAQLFHATSRRATYEAIVFDEPTATGGPAGWFFSDQRLLKYVVFRCPAFTLSTGLDGMFYNTLVGHTDVGWWTLDGVKTFGTGRNNNLKTDGRAASRLRGTLKLPSVTVISPHVFQENNLGEAWLAYGDAKVQILNIQSNAFNSAGITNLVLNAAPDLAVGEGAFLNLPNLKSVTYLGPVVNEDAFAAILASATDAAPATVYASAFLGWDKAGYLDAPTADERTNAPDGGRVLGVWRGPDGTAPLAWVCHRPSPFDPKRTVILLR